MSVGRRRIAELARAAIAPSEPATPGQRRGHCKRLVLPSEASSYSDCRSVRVGPDPSGGRNLFGFDRGTISSVVQRAGVETCCHTNARTLIFDRADEFHRQGLSITARLSVPGSVGRRWFGLVATVVEFLARELQLRPRDRANKCLAWW